MVSYVMPPTGPVALTGQLIHEDERAPAWTREMEPRAIARRDVFILSIGDVCFCCFVVVSRNGFSWSWSYCRLVIVEKKECRAKWSKVKERGIR